MDTTDILERLESLGVSIRLVGAELVLHPGSKVPHDLLDDLRREKFALIAALEAQPQQRCAACLCADYCIALAQGCATCQGAVCARCGGCKRAQRNDPDSLIPGPSDLTRAQVEARDRLLARLREGSQVLTETQHRLLETRKTEEGIERQFLRWLDAWDGLDFMVRFLYAFKGCVLAPGLCLGDAPIRCRACGKVQP